MDPRVSGNAATRCPLCGGPNDCGMAGGHSSCWCFSTPIPAEVLARVPEDQRNLTCVCQRCAEAVASQAEGDTPA